MYAVIAVDMCMGFLSYCGIPIVVPLSRLEYACSKLLIAACSMIARHQNGHFSSAHDQGLLVPCHCQWSQPEAPGAANDS
jgi:hypothetical protein